MALRIGSDVLMHGLIFKFKTLQPQLHNVKISEVISYFAIKGSLARNSDSLSIVNVNKENESRKVDKA